MMIKEVTKEGIYYTNQLGKTAFLSFEECYNNWLKSCMDKGNLNDEQISTNKRSTA